MFDPKSQRLTEEEKEEEVMLDEEALESEDVVGKFNRPTMKNRSRLSTISKGFDSGDKVSVANVSRYNNSLLI